MNKKMLLRNSIILMQCEIDVVLFVVDSSTNLPVLTRFQPNRYERRQAQIWISPIF
jgi:hypothetical protein